MEGAAPLVDVQSSGISEVVRNEEILALPLNGRNAVELVAIAGAAVQVTNAPSACGARRHGYLGRRRPVVRRGVPARRRDAQQPAGQPEPAVPVPRRAAGVQRRDQRPERPARHALGRRGQRRHQVGHQPLQRERLRVPARPPLQRDQPVCADRSRTANGSTMAFSATSSAARSAARLCRTGCSSSAPSRARSVRQQPAANIARVPTRRCSPATSRPSPRRPATAGGKSRSAAGS